jgi:orotate phosphoribosyltransferase
MNIVNLSDEVFLVPEGNSLLRKAEEIAMSLKDTDFDTILVKEYKNMPLAMATAICMFKVCGRDVYWAIERHEPKDHGEECKYIGKLGDKVLNMDEYLVSYGRTNS